MALLLFLFSLIAALVSGSPPIFSREAGLRGLLHLSLPPSFRFDHGCLEIVPLSRPAVLSSEIGLSLSLPPAIIRDFFRLFHSRPVFSCRVGHSPFIEERAPESARRMPGSSWPVFSLLPGSDDDLVYRRHGSSLFFIDRHSILLPSAIAAFGGARVPFFS